MGIGFNAHTQLKEAKIWQEKKKFIKGATVTARFGLMQKEKGEDFK